MESMEVSREALWNNDELFIKSSPRNKNSREFEKLGASGFYDMALPHKFTCRLNNQNITATYTTDRKEFNGAGVWRSVYSGNLELKREDGTQVFSLPIGSSAPWIETLRITKDKILIQAVAGQAFLYYIAPSEHRVNLEYNLNETISRQRLNDDYKTLTSR